MFFVTSIWLVWILLKEVSNRIQQSLFIIITSNNIDYTKIRIKAQQKTPSIWKALVKHKSYFPTLLLQVGIYIRTYDLVRAVEVRVSM